MLVMHSLLHEACYDALSRSRVKVPRNKYETRKNCVKCFMQPTQDRVPILSPHECVVRLGCSWTPQARQHAEVQDVDDSVAVEAGQESCPSLSVLASNHKQVRNIHSAVRAHRQSRPGQPPGRVLSFPRRRESIP